MTAMTAYQRAVAKLRRADGENEIDLAAIVIRMLTYAGAMSEWDSGTIENVLYPTLGMAEAVGIPWIGTADDPDAHRFWADIANDLDIETDFEDDELTDEEKFDRGIR